VTLKVLGCSGGVGPGSRPSCYLVGSAVAIDAGCLASALAFEEQRRVRHVLLSHSHLDHLRDLPLFLDNVYGAGEPPVSVLAPEPVLDALRAHIFNGLLWPDLIALARPFAVLEAVSPGAAIPLGEVEATPFASYHGLPATGYLLRRAGAAGRPATLALTTDTGYEPQFFADLAALEDLASLVIETSFPDRLSDVAQRSYHLTPSMLRRGLEPVLEAHPDLEVLVTHLKPSCREEVASELEGLGIPLRILADGDELPLP
jgi:cAMP phosphodiesterase